MSAQVSRWLKTYSSKETRRRYEFAFYQFLKFHNVKAEDTLEWSVVEAEDHLIDWKTHLVESDKAGSSIKVAFTVIKQWYRFNRIRVDVQCKNVSSTRTYLDYLPTREDVQRLLDTAKLHHRVVIALIAFAGLRPVDVASLQYKHIKASFEAGDEVLTINKIQQKTKEWYSTFLGFQGTRYLRSYLEERKSKGEIIKDSTHIIISRKNNKAVPVTVHGVTAAVRRAIQRTVGEHPTGESFRLFRPYGLRKYFRRTVGKLGESTAEYLMGHQKGYESLSATYSGLRDLDPKAINDLKQQYIGILGELETEVSDPSLRQDIEGIQEELKDLKDFVGLLRTHDKDKLVSKAKDLLSDAAESGDKEQAMRGLQILERFFFKSREVEMVDLRENVMEMKEFLRQLMEEEDFEKQKKTKKT